MSVVGYGEVVIVPSFKGLQSDVGKEIAGIGDSKPVKNAGYDLGAGLKKAAKIGLAGGAVVLGTALAKGFGRLQAIENARAKLSGLGHDAQSVEQIMGNATAAVKGTAFGLGDAATAAAGMVAAGVKPGQELERTLTLIGDAASIAGTDFNSMSAIFQKAAASNKIQMDVINQLHDAGVPALQLLADEMGVTAEEASKMASKGEIDFATFEKAMTTGMGGAAQKSGETLQGAFANSMAALGRFGANLMSDIYPQLTSFFGNFITWMGPVEEMGKQIGEYLGEALKGMIKLLQDVGSWIQKNQAWLTPLAVAVGAMAGVWGLWTLGIKAWTVATKVAATVQGLLNKVMNANPILKVVALITGLVAAVVWLYNNNETARKIIDAAWKGIRDGIKAAVDWIIGAWNNVKTWLTVTLPAGFNSFRDTATDAWTKVKDWISNAWGTIKGIFSTVRDWLRNTLGGAFTFLRDRVKSVWDGIKTIIKGVWETYIQPVFKTIQQVLKGDFVGAFQTAKDAIDRIWKNVANVVRKPINFVINTVYTGGIKKVFDKVAGVVGLPKLPEVASIPAFAKGGQMRTGWKLVGEEGPELIHTGPGHVYTAAQTKAMLEGRSQAPDGALDELHEQGVDTTSHAGIGGFWSNAWDNIKGAARSVGDAVKKGLDWVRGGLAKAADWVLGPLKDGLTSNLGSTGFGGLASGLAKKAIDGVISFLKGKDEEFPAEGSDSAVFYDGALGKFAKPASGHITSGFGASRGKWPHMGIDFAVPIGSAVRSMLNGIVRKTSWNAASGRTGKGMIIDHAQGYSSYYGHLSSWGKKPGDRVSAGERVAGSGNTGNSTGPHLHAELWRNGKPFNYRSYLYDNGGVVPTGLRAIVNASKKPEALLTNSQWKSAMKSIEVSHRLADGAGTSTTYTYQAGDSGGSAKEFFETAAFEQRKHARVGGR